MTVRDTHPHPDPIADFPLSAVQKQFWVFDQLDPGTPALNVAVRWRLTGQFQAANIERAFRHIIDRHEILRTRFVEDDGLPVQQVMDSAEFKLGHVDLRATPADQHQTRVDTIALEDAARPFDLTQPCQLRATLVRLTADEAILLITAHHIVFDGFSIGVLGRELGDAAEAYEAGYEPQLPDLPLQYGDVCLWQQEMYASGAIDADAAYWQDQLADLPYFELPADHPRPPERSAAIATIRHPLPKGFGDRLEGLARDRQVSPFVLGAAVVAACLHRQTGAQDLAFGIQTAGRNEVELEPLIGAFINTLVLRFQTDDSASFGTLLAQAKTRVADAIAHQALPFTDLVDRLNLPRDASRTPLVSVNFNLSKVFMQGRRHGDFEIASVPSHTPGATYDLYIALIGRPDGWLLSVDYAPALYDRTTAEALAAQLADSFATIFDTPEAPLAALPAPAPRTPQQAPPPAVPALETVLQSHPLVARATQRATAQGPYAFVSPPPHSHASLETLPGELMTLAAKALPPQDRPVGISVLASLPTDPALLPLPSGNQPAPAQDVHSTLRAMWADVLGTPNPPEDVSFFNLGGNSLQAVRLLTRMRREWPLKLGIAQIYDNPTLAQMGALIAAQLGDTPEPAQDDWRVVPLVEGAQTPQLIGFNNIGTMLATAQDPASQRGAICVRLFDGTHADNIDGLSFTEIAALYARAVTRAQPQGPYLLFGLCVHGNLALEAARVLQDQGHEVSGVILKDVWEPTYFEHLHADRRMRWREKFHALGERIRRVRDGTLSLSAMLGSYRLIRATGVLQLLTALGLIDRVRISDLDPLQEEFTTRLTLARDAYRPQPFNGKVLHVVTKFSPQGRGFKPSIGWEDVVKGPLKTVHLDEVLVHGNRRIGTSDLAREIEAFLQETA